MRAAIIVVGMLAAGCAQPQLTEILVVTDTDLEVPAEVSSVRFRVVGPSGEEKTAAADLASAQDRPAVLALVHRGGALGPFVVEVRGEGSTGELVVERAARVSFVPGEVLVLPMHLLAGCAGVSCGEDESCGEGGCRPRDVERSELQAWNGEPPGLEPRELDGGADAGPDADMQDAGAECELDADCDDRIACTIDACAGGSCTRVPDTSRCAADEHACTIETCDSTLGCVPQLEHALCDDAVACTTDRCDVDEGCVFAPADANCDDGVACTVDRCDPLLGCASTPDDARCDDGIACTVDVCDALLGCAHTADDARCDDGVGCTVDACDVATGCSWSSTPVSCPVGERCDPSAGVCLPSATFSEVYAFLARDCVGACHDAGADGGLDLSSRALAHAGLVSVAALCDAGSSTRVIPYDARRSLLWRKVARVDLCGARMPPAGAPTSSADVALLESWIAGGALDN